MTPPTENEVILILCEDVRQELGNKLSFLGVFIGGDIGLTNSTNLPTMLSSLTFAFWIKGGEGTFQQTIKIVKPSGAVIASSPITVLTKLANVAAMSVIRFTPFQIDELGIHKVIFTVDQKSYEQSFLIHLLPESN